MNVGERCQQVPGHPPRSFAAYLAEVGETADVRRGIPIPLGARELDGGVNFALFSRHATRVQLELYAGSEDLQPAKVFELDPAHNRTGDIWHIWVKGLQPGQLYGYRMDGPYDPESGQWFDFGQLLLDPFATAVKRPASRAVPLKAVVTHERFDWQDDTPPRHPWSRTVIYETHVRGLTAHPSSQVRFPGTYRGLTEKIPYLKELGVTAVELLPVQEFDPSQCRRHDPRTGERLRNYWGYDPIAFFAPNGAYSSSGDSGQQTLEFKEMVRQLHAADIEVIIDMVLDHTAESDEHGSAVCLRGIDNSIYYCLPQDKRHYADAASRGSTLNANHPAVRQLIISALRYWVVEMHIDGIRLDLAAILGRDSSGALLRNPPLLEQIAEDPILRETKLIAAGWDLAGASNVGSFPERQWAEWNLSYRDDIRRFWRGDEGLLAAFARRVCGSQDLYGPPRKAPVCGINLITCHDGFTLNDLVSYQCKHNLANGEDNHDGTDDNYSANYGAEGPTDDGHVEAIRKRQVKNFLLTLLVSRGVPMLLGGDEFRRTQRGNNNAYCQDNETSWYDWDALRSHSDLRDFVRGMLVLRGQHPVLSSEQFYTPGQARWVSPTLTKPDWEDPHARTAGCLIRDAGRDTLFMMFNAGHECVSFLVPPAPAQCEWRLAADTATDLPVSANGPLVQGAHSYRLAPRSSVVLVASPGGPLTKSQPYFAGRGCDPLIDASARAIGGEDPEAAYAAAMLWYQGYP